MQNRMQVFEGGLHLETYFNHIACRDCKIRSQRTTSKRAPRRIKRRIQEAETEAMLERLDHARETPVIRKKK